MVRTVSPKARATPAKPRTSWGNAAARPADPHPPRTNHAVPMNSAISFRCIVSPFVYEDTPRLRSIAFGTAALVRFEMPVGLPEGGRSAETAPSGSVQLG